jgi:hypothetical protein
MLQIGLAASKGRSQLDRLAWLATMLVITATPMITFATTQEIPAISVTIQFTRWGGDHAFRALEAAATKAGLTCNPSVKDYEQRRIKDEHGKFVTHPRQLRCGFGISGSITARTNSYTSSGGIELSAYYELPRRNGTSIVKPTIDEVVAAVEDALKVDPLIPAIEQTLNVNSNPFTSKIK